MKVVLKIPRSLPSRILGQGQDEPPGFNMIFHKLLASDICEYCPLCRARTTKDKSFSFTFLHFVANACCIHTRILMYSYTEFFTHHLHNLSQSFTSLKIMKNS